MIKLFILLLSEESGLVNPVTSVFEWNSDLDQGYRKYKYIGKEKNGDKEYIRFSLEDKNGISKEIYYVDIINKTISKIERYVYTLSGDIELDSITNYSYSYNTVTDEDVAKFDISNYQEYEYKEY